MVRKCECSKTVKITKILVDLSLISDLTFSTITRKLNNIINYTASITLMYTKFALCKYTSLWEELS